MWSCRRAFLAFADQPTPSECGDPAAGYAYTAPAAAGAALAVIGLMVFTVSVALQRRSPVVSA